MSTTGRWEELFGTDKWRVLEEACGVVVQDGAQVEFSRGGRFRILTDGCAFESPLSTNRGKTGFILQKTDETGEHDIPGARIPIGEHALRAARKDWGAVW